MSLDQFAAEQLAQLGIADGDRIEVCWPETYQESIQRSLVANDTLWTMAPSALQANRLEDLSIVVSLGLR